MMKYLTRPVIHMFTLVAVLLAVGLPLAGQQGTVPAQSGKMASALSGEHRKVTGTITERNGDTIMLRLSPGQSIAVKVGTFTEIREKKINPFRKARKYQIEQLMPGLAVEIDGRGDAEGSLVARKVTLRNDDYKTAQLIDVRVSPVEANGMRMSGQINELSAVSNAARGGAKAAQDTADSAHARIAALDDYESVNSIMVRFKVGSAVLSPEAKKSLDDLAIQSKSLKGFVIEVAGFASSEGSLSFNRRLSRQRAEAVSEYLAEEHDIPLRRIMTPTGYGVSHPISDNSTHSGRQENRRVEVRLMMSKGIATQASASQHDLGNKQGADVSITQDR